MDQDSTNGTSSDKPKWRERLGIGAKDMPRISDEFKSQPFAAPGAKSEGRNPQPVTRLAPMAPRTHTQQPAVRTSESGDPPPEPEIQASDGLAEKLRAQRAAAEMLAVQRVSAARQRAEARIAAEPSSPMQRAPNDIPSKDISPKDIAPKNVTPARPKFSFADEDQSAKRHEPSLTLDKGSNGTQRNSSGLASSASLVPPRPALGAERPQSSLLRQSASPYRPDAAPAFRPIDPATGYPGTSSRMAPSGGPRAYPQEPGGLGSMDRNLARKPTYDPFRRNNNDNASFGADIRDENLRGDPRLGHSLATRNKGNPAPEELDDVFEDEAPPPRRRAGASDYQSAYREAEESGTDDDRRRSNGPWLLLLALLVAAVATGGVIWLWSKSAETTATNGTTDTVPVIAAPEEPTKTAAERPADSTGDVAAVNRKQIYDRIVGDQEVTGDTVVPTEITPIQPEAFDSRDVSQPTGTSEEGSDEAVPLALPPAPGQNTEGRIDQDTDQRVVATAGQSATEEIKTETSAQSGDSIGSLLPPAGVEEEASPPETKTATTGGSSSASTDSGSTAPVEPEMQPPPVRKKAATTKKRKPPADSTASLGEPRVVAPPGDIMAPSQETFEPQALSTDVAPKQPPARRKRTLFDLFSGNKNDPAPSQNAVVKQPAPQANKLASLPIETERAAPEKQTAARGYVVQLSSFRNQDEAQIEYARLRSKYASVIGSLPSSISQTTVAGSTRHTLGLGPLTTQQQASQICGSLLAGGERDCRVRKQ